MSHKIYDILVFLALFSSFLLGVSIGWLFFYEYKERYQKLSRAVTRILSLSPREFEKVQQRMNRRGSK